MKTLTYYKFLLFPYLIYFVLFVSLDILYAQTSEVFNKQEPFHIESDKMIVKKDSSMVEFIGNVKTRQKDSRVSADSIKIYFHDNKNQNDKNINNNTGAGSNIKKIVSTGNVRYVAGEREAFADKAVYTIIDDTLVLTGTSVKLITGASFVTGKKITLFSKQDKVVVESGENSRVEALFNPEDNDKKNSSNKKSFKNRQQ